MFSPGCGNVVVNDKPSYADLVVVYNAEQEALDRLERQRKDLLAEYESKLRPSTEDAVRALSDILNSAAGAGLDPGQVRTPHDELDLAVERAEKSQQDISQLFDAAAQATPPEGADLSPEQAALKEEFDQKLAELDAQINEQKARVERARQARDAAEVR